MSRPAESTRGSIIKAAIHLFAEKGFEGASVRDIVAKARVNQAAVNYHFKGKDGLYLEVLKTAFEKLTEHAGFDPGKLKALSREEALRSFVHQQLRPLLFRDEMSRYIRLFAWESAHPSKIFLKFMATNTVSYLTTAVDIVSRFLPPHRSPARVTHVPSCRRPPAMMSAAPASSAMYRGFSYRISMTAVPISIRSVFAPTAASSGKGEPSCRAK
jgi:AcrR family transcriptional regulator